jgi:hypothetical protein
MPSFFFLVSADEGGRIRWHWDHCYCTRACDVRGARMGCLNLRRPYFKMECIYCIGLLVEVEIQHKGCPVEGGRIRHQ